jgi:hypothetical protein
MKTKQANKLNMYNTVSGVMNDNKEIWSKVYQLKNVFDRFSENTDRLTALKTEQEKDLQPLLSAMFEKRETLIISGTPVVNIILAYSHDKKEKKLLKKMNLSKNKLEKSKDSDLIEECKTIYKAAKKLYKKSIAEKENSENKSVKILEYGLSEKMIVDLQTAVNDIIKSRLALHEAIQGKDKMDKQITSILKKNEKLLKNKMDLLISIFETSKPDFYKTYLDARVIQKTETDKIKGKKGKKAKKEELPENDEIAG